MALSNRGLLCYPNWLDADPRFAVPAVLGGAWRNTLPLRNVLAWQPLAVARSINNSRAATRAWIDLGTLRHVQAVVIPRIVCSREATGRCRGFEAMDEASTMIAGSDSGAIDVYPVIYPPGTLPSWHPSFTDGRLTEEDAAKFPMPWYAVYETPFVARYLLLETDDHLSTLGYVDWTRLVVSPGWQPPLNFVFGAAQGIEPRTTVEEAYGGAEFFEVLDGRRVARFGYDYLPEDDALVWAGDMMAELGIHRQLYYIHNPTDTAHKHRRSFLARMKVLRDLEYARYRRVRATFELIEVIE